MLVKLRQWRSLYLFVRVRGRNLEAFNFPRKGQGFISRCSYCTSNNILPSSSIFVQVVQSGGSDVSGSVYIFTDSKRYLVNNGENTLRYLRGSGLAVNGMDKIFLTGSTLNHIGGLTNTLLATQDMHMQTETPIHVYGSHDLEPYMHTTRRSFQYLSKFDFVNLCSVDERTSFQEILRDENFKIWACAVSIDPSSQNSEVDSVIYKKLAISYVFQLQPAPRRVLLDKAHQLGIEEHVLHEVVGECQKGQTVTLPDGNMIMPDDILHPEESKQYFLVVDCPSLHVFKMLQKLFKSYASNQQDAIHPNLVIHLTPLAIARTTDYQAWMSTFDRGVNHLLLNNDSTPSSTLHGFDEIYQRLHRNHPQVFPHLTNYTSLDSGTLKDLRFLTNVSAGFPSLKYIFRPHRVCGFHLGSYETMVLSSHGNCETKADRNLEKENDFEVVFLGTGSRVSSILRNTSGILLNLRGSKSLLMDCGEGTYRQLCQHYGNDVGKILKQIRGVFVSHMHIDHHLGLANILLQRKKFVGSNDYVRIIGPESLDLFLRYFEMLSGESLNFRFTQFWWLKRESGKKQGRTFSNSLGFSSIAVVPTKHSDYSHGVVLERNNWKIVYSADTRPCKQLIDAGNGANLLIHEATFSDDLVARAKAMNHCTVSEAIQTAKLMNAQHTILTHISSRHLFPCKVSRLPKGVSFALDHMTIQQKDLPFLHAMMPAIDTTLRGSQQSQKTFNRKRRKNNSILRPSVSDLFL